MNQATWLQDRRMQKFRDVLSRWERRELSVLEAGELLGCSERQFRRYRHRYEDEGLAGLVDKRLGKASAKRVPVDKIAWLTEQYRTHHMGWNVKHFHEHLQQQHGFRWGYTWTKTQLHTAGLVERSKRRGAHRRKRPRKPGVGMMLHQDGSRAEWLAGTPREGRHYRDRRRQPVDPGSLFARPQRSLRQAAAARGQRIRSRDRCGKPRRDPVHRAGAHRGPRQHRHVRRPQPAAARKPRQSPLRQG